MGTAERRIEILKILSKRRSEKTKKLAEELGVSERTIRRDILVLSLTEPIYTRAGRYGGVWLGFSKHRECDAFPFFAIKPCFFINSPRICNTFVTQDIL